MSNHIPKATALAVSELVRSGASTQQIMAQTKVAKSTALRFRKTVLTGKATKQVKRAPAAPVVAQATCASLDEIDARWPAAMGRESQAWRGGA